jgi:hypothetical protein
MDMYTHKTGHPLKHEYWKLWINDNWGDQDQVTENRQKGVCKQVNTDRREHWAETALSRDSTLVEQSTRNIYQGLNVSSDMDFA